MVSPKLMMFFMSLMVMGQIISMGISGDWASGDDWDEISEEMTGFSASDINGIGAIPIAFSGFVTNGLPRMLSWDYAFFECDDVLGLQSLLLIVQGALIIIVSGGLLWGIVTQFQAYMIPAIIGSGALWGIGSLLS